MDISNPYVPTNTQLREAVPFTNFDTELYVTYDKEASADLRKDYWCVEASFRYYISEQERDVYAYVPAGFLSDGASVPRPFWWIVPPWGSYGQAAVLHDMLCETLTLFKDEVPVSINRKQADKIFRDAMKAAGVGRFYQYVMYAAVRAWSALGIKPDLAQRAQKRAIETVYQKERGTYREPTAILQQITRAMRRANGQPVGGGFVTSLE